MEDEKLDSLDDNDSKINQHLENIKSGLEITGKKVMDGTSKAIDASSKWTSEGANIVVEK